SPTPSWLPDERHRQHPPGCPSPYSRHCSPSSSGSPPELSRRESPDRSVSILKKATWREFGPARPSSQGDERPLTLDRRESRMIERALVDYYRCPEEFVKMSLTGDLSADSGYFRFGRDLCYGQTSCGPRYPLPTNGLYDTLPDVKTENGVLRVPFNPSQVIDNFRLERYSADSQGASSMRQPSWQRRYYSLRRFMPAPVRRQLQRRY